MLQTFPSWMRMLSTKNESRSLMKKMRIVARRTQPSQKRKMIMKRMLTSLLFSQSELSVAGQTCDLNLDDVVIMGRMIMFMFSDEEDQDPDSLGFLPISPEIDEPEENVLLPPTDPTNQVISTFFLCQMYMQLMYL